MDLLELSDQFIRCANCRIEFIHTRGQQWQAQAEGQPAPTLCPLCTLYDERQRVRQKGLAEGQVVAGRVKWYDTRKGFGFIQLDDGTELFLHSRGIKAGQQKAVRRGKRVQALVQQTEKGPQASEVEVITETQADTEPSVSA